MTYDVASRNRAAADAAALDLWRRLGPELEGLSIAELAAELNRRGEPTPRGGRWHKTSAARLLERVREAEGAITRREATLLAQAVRMRLAGLRRVSPHHHHLEPLSRVLAAIEDADGTWNERSSERSSERCPLAMDGPVASPLSLAHHLHAAVSRRARDLAREGELGEARELVRVARRLWPEQPINLEVDVEPPRR